MAIVEMLMPKMGESVMEGTVLSWLKGVGETIEEDESLLEVATDKVDTEIPSTHSGVIKAILAQEGDVIQIGKPMCIIENDSEAESASVQTTAPDTKVAKTVKQAEEVLETAIATASTESSAVPRISNGKFYSPLVRNIAQQENVSVTELNALEGSGQEGRVTKKDILTFLKTRKTNGAALGTAPQVPVTISAQDEIIQMNRMRKVIAERMIQSKQISAHVTSFVEADMTAVVQWRNKIKNDFKKRQGEPLTFTPIFIEAVVQAIRDFPMINIQIDGDRIIKKAEINIGLAVALPTGNLIVPVIHNADQMSLVDLTKKVNDLANRARKNKLKPDELQGGTYTISNIGSFGNVMGTPILMQPQVGILALGAIQKKPAVIETPEGDLIGIRHKMFLSHSYDHRVVDGALGGMLVKRVAEYLEGFDSSRTL